LATTPEQLRLCVLGDCGHVIGKPWAFDVFFSGAGI